MLGDRACFVHVLLEAAVAHEVGPPFETFTQIDISQFVYNRATVLSFHDLCLYDSFIAEEMLSDTFLMEEGQDAVEVFQGSGTTSVLGEVLRADHRGDTLEGVSINLGPHHIFQIGQTLRQIKRHVPPPLQRSPDLNFQPEPLVLVENRIIPSDLDRQPGPLVPLLQQPPMYNTFNLLLRMLLLLDRLVHAPVPIQPGVPYLLHPPLFDEPFDIFRVLVFDVFSFLCIEKILILFNLAF